MTHEQLDDVMRRALQFQMMELPGQGPMMHMGTSYLVNDLARAVSELRADRTPDPAQIRADALREAASVDWSHGTDVFDKAPEFLTPWQRGLVAGQMAMRDGILALLATPLSPTAVDGSIAPDAGGK